ncbi:MAG TPA: phosphatidate cytidylyltransferase [Candidatus Acidoferrales bacterium]|nr:phosphatidate cytidylyltransferase [Candidatus Acidoferrales bacterium]
MGRDACHAGVVRVTGARVLTAALLIPLVVFAVLWTDTWVIAGLVAAVVILCLHEFFRLGAAAGAGGDPRWTTVCALLLVGLQCLESSHQGRWMRSEFGLLYSPDRTPLPPDIALAVFMMGAAALAVAGRARLKEAIPRLGVNCAAMLLVALPLSFLVRLHGMDPLGPRIVLFLLVLLWVGDTLAYFTGRSVGRHKMAPELSPGKTWEGAAANLLGSILVGLASARWIALPPVHLMVMAGLANVAGQVGDLTESAYKRSAGVKDSGALLPGHGGMLDRVDSLIFAAPVVWYYFRILLPAVG